MEEEIAQEEKRHRQETRQWEKKVKEAQDRLNGLTTELKAKEQENRLSKLKIKEMQRLQKHNQLKPLPDVSQSKIAPLNKENLGRLKNTEENSEEGSERLPKIQ